MHLEDMGRSSSPCHLSFKASLVALFFMRLFRGEGDLLVLATTVLFFFVLLFVRC
jgi:hypothetical protein